MRSTVKLAEDRGKGCRYYSYVRLQDEVERASNTSDLVPDLHGLPAPHWSHVCVDALF